MVATIKNSITSEAFNNVEQSSGYDDMVKLNDPYKLYLFIYHQLRSPIMI